MVNIRFKYIVGVIVALVITGGTLAFKEVTKSKKAVVTQWYSLDITGSDPEDLDDQEITGILPEQPTGPDCKVTNTSDPCAVHLDSPSPLPSGITVQEAFDQYSAAFASGEDYSREP